MKDGYFVPGDIESARRCMKKFDEYIVARHTGYGGHELPDARAGLHPEMRTGYDHITGAQQTFFCLLSCIELRDAQHYVNSNNLQDDSAIGIYRIGDNTFDRVDL